MRVSNLVEVISFLVLIDSLGCRNGQGCPKKVTELVSDCTTLRRHMAASHKVCFLAVHVRMAQGPLTLHLGDLQDMVQETEF